MANFILTTKCNKGCPYCFARDVRQKEPNKDMSLELFKTLVEKQDINEPVKFLGGEPTQYSFFKEALDYCFQKKRRVTLISNFLFNEDILHFILNYVDKMPLTFLVNSTDLDVKDRIKTFSKNYNEIYVNLYKINAEENLACGITIDESKPIDYYLNYLDFLKANLSAIESLRISLNHPGDDTKKNCFSFINNKNLGEYIVFITKKALDLNIPIHNDCITFPCIYSNKEEFKFIRKFLGQSLPAICGLSGGGPTDLFPDGTASYCYPTKRIQVETGRFKTMNDISEALALKYKINKMAVALPEECTKCGFLHKECEGPCLAYFDWKTI